LCQEQASLRRGNSSSFMQHEGRKRLSTVKVLALP
jgi:hypothetical protein